MRAPFFETQCFIVIIVISKPLNRLLHVSYRQVFLEKSHKNSATTGFMDRKSVRRRKIAAAAGADAECFISPHHLEQAGYYPAAILRPEWLISGFRA